MRGVTKRRESTGGEIPQHGLQVAWMLEQTWPHLLQVLEAGFGLRYMSYLEV